MCSSNINNPHDLNNNRNDEVNKLIIITVTNLAIAAPATEYFEFIHWFPYPISWSLWTAAAVVAKRNGHKVGWHISRANQESSFLLFVRRVDRVDALAVVDADLRLDQNKY